MKRVLPILVFLFTALPSLPAAAAVKVAVVDVQQVMNATTHWKKAVEQLEKDRKSKQAVLEAKQRELKERKEQLDAKKVVSDPKSTIKEEETLFQEAQVLTQQFMMQQQELTMWEKRITEQMLQRVELVVREIALLGEYQFVFEVGAEEQPNVLYADRKVDVTAKVIELYHKRYKGKPLDVSKK